MEEPKTASELPSPGSKKVFKRPTLAENSEEEMSENNGSQQSTQQPETST